MTEDLLKRLREAGNDYTVAWGSGELYDEAADEIERLTAALGRTGPLGRAISVLQDVLTDIEDWEDKALAEAVTDARLGLLMMLEAEKLKRESNPVPRVIQSGTGGVNLPDGAKHG